LAQIDLIDTSVRDGNQSLWGATGLNTAMMLEIAPVMDQVGFAAIDFSTSTHMAVAVRFKKENPWDRLRLMRKAMPLTPLQFLTTGMRFISWELAHPEFMRLTFRLLNRNGIRRFAVMDSMNDMDALLAVAGAIRAEGGDDIIAALTYSVSPIHTDEHYVSCAKTLAQSPTVDGFYLKDPGGLLTAERAASLIPRLCACAANLPFELHSHCTIGLAPFSYLEAARLGARAVHVAAAPLGNGTSQPSAERTVANLREEGHSVAIDDKALARMSDYFRRLAAAEGLPVGQPQEFDSGYFRHQVPGGMVGTTRRQLAEIKLLDRLPAVLEEVALVRAELGYPIMVTPFSQIVVTQAVMNVIAGERYSNLPDEVIRYVGGKFGKPTVAVEPNVLDKIMSLPRAQALLEEPTMPELSELRRKFEPGIDDEELVLRVVMPQDQVDAMKAAGPVRQSYNPGAKPILTLLEAVSRRTDLSYFSVQKPGLQIVLTR
jgi:oxaloacetate decarboxylase (Na+ extruding) subunit alpha